MIGGALGKRKGLGFRGLGFRGLGFSGLSRKDPRWERGENTRCKA